MGTGGPPLGRGRPFIAVGGHAVFGGGPFVDIGGPSECRRHFVGIGGSLWA